MLRWLVIVVITLRGLSYCLQIGGLPSPPNCDVKQATHTGRHIPVPCFSTQFEGIVHFQDFAYNSLPMLRIFLNTIGEIQFTVINFVALNRRVQYSKMLAESGNTVC